MVWKRTYVYERRVHFCYMFHQLDIYIMYIAHINKEIKFYNCKLHYIEAVILLEYGLKSRVTMALKLRCHWKSITFELIQIKPVKPSLNQLGKQSGPKIIDRLNVSTACVQGFDRLSKIWGHLNWALFE